MFDNTTTEKQWQAWVVRQAMLNRFAYYHAPDNKPDANGRVQMIVAGFPDLVMVKGSRMIFAELKRESGKVTEAQKIWLKRLEATGAECYIWRPSQWEEVLSILESDD